MQFNLLLDKWIPVKKDDTLEQISLKELLCSNTPRETTHPRAEFEMATLQMCAAIVQTVFPPATKAELVKRITVPMPEAEYDELAAPFLSFFYLREEGGEKPFMQSLRPVDPNDTDTKKNDKLELTSLQKLFPGLPGGSGNGCFFIGETDIAHICPSCAAIGLFNRGTNTPSFGGGFKVGLRGESPLTVMVHDPDLRRMIWKNIFTLDSDFMESMEGMQNDPVWITPIPTGGVIDTNTIGLPRGLFWQPFYILMIWEEGEGICDACGSPYSLCATGFIKQRMGFTYYPEHWVNHPYSPFRMGTIKNDGIETKYMGALSAKNSTPSWALLKDIFPPAESGNTWSKVVENYKDMSRDYGTPSLVIGGYKNEKSKIDRRRHELFSITAGWRENVGEIRKIVEFGLDVQYCMRASIKSFLVELKTKDKDKKSPADKSFTAGLTNKADTLFFNSTDEIMRKMISATGEEDAYELINKNLYDLKVLVKQILNDITWSYARVPGGLEAGLKAERFLENFIEKVYREKYKAPEEKKKEEHDGEYHSAEN